MCHRTYLLTLNFVFDPQKYGNRLIFPSDLSPYLKILMKMTFTVPSDSLLKIYCFSETC